MKRLAFLIWALHAAAFAGLDVDFVKGLIAIPSESRSIPECNRATAFLKGYLEERGVYCHVERTVEGREALYASTVPGKECDYAFVTHIDVVPAQSPEQYEPKIVGDEIYGRGACDTKVNAALIAQVLVELKGEASVGAFFATDEDGCVGSVPTCTMLRNAGYTPRKMVLVGDTVGDVTNTLFHPQRSRTTSQPAAVRYRPQPTRLADSLRSIWRTSPRQRTVCGSHPACRTG